MTDYADMTIAQITEAYNKIIGEVKGEHPFRPIKKFKDKPSALKRMADVKAFIPTKKDIKKEKKRYRGHCDGRYAPLSNQVHPRAPKEGKKPSLRYELYKAMLSDDGLLYEDALKLVERLGGVTKLTTEYRTYRLICNFNKLMGWGIENTNGFTKGSVFTIYADENE